LNLSPPYLALRPNITFNFGGSDGVPPYSYSVTQGAWTIDQNGNFVSNVYGPNTLQAVDSVGATATSLCVVLHPLELFCDILAQGLGLPKGRVWIFNQKINEPTDFNLYCVVHLLSHKVFSSTNLPPQLPQDTNQDQTVNTMATLQFDLKSRSTQALYSSLAAVQALSSTYSTQQQELNSLKIFRLPRGLVNLSSLDASAIPYRFSGTCCIMYSEEIMSQVPYYNVFSNPTVVEEP
jgi:hypothetical protein